MFWNITRGILTVLLVYVWSISSAILEKSAQVYSANLSVRQLENTNEGAIVGTTVSDIIMNFHMPAILLLLLVGLIWFAPIRNLFNKINAPQLGIILVCSMVVSAPSFAYYDTKDNPEFVEIMPNQTAFAIPETGANLTNQVAFGSEAYFAANKVALKRFEVKHVLIRNSTFDRDYYVPKDKLLLIDRSPYMREWTDDVDRGTSSKKESIRFQSADSVNMHVGIVISGSVTEENAAKFVYNFGAKPTKTVSNDPATTFASVIEGKSLAEVMDTNIRGRVHAVLAREFGKLSTDDCNKKASEVITIVEKEVKDYAASKGITIDYIGYATAIDYDNSEIQTSIDKTFIAIKDAQAANALAAVLPIQQAQTNMEVQRTNAATLAKWNGQVPAMPSWLVVSDNLFDAIAKIFGNSAKK